MEYLIQKIYLLNLNLIKLFKISAFSLTFIAKIHNMGVKGSFFIDFISKVQILVINNFIIAVFSVINKI
jgi:hypothetical protein